jgi:protein-S-isoprenylcysteine O-methyltransferase Ste14
MKLFIALRALIYMTGFVLLWGWLSLNMRPYDARFGFSLPGWSGSLGILLLVIGFGIAVACAGFFVVQGHGTPAPFDAPRKLVVAGPYRYVRNPMYVGGFLALIGFGLLLRSFSALLFALVPVVLFNFFVLFYEEPQLRKQFGTSYENYCRTVNRWIPRLPS